MKKFISILLIFSLCFSFNFSTASAAVKINKSKLSITIGHKSTLKISGTKKKVEWYSDDKEIATVSSKGVVTAVSVGDVTISAKVNGTYYCCTVSVFPKDKSITLYEDDYLKMTYMNAVNNVIYFKIYNKTDDMISIMDLFTIINGTTYPETYSNTDIAPNASGIYMYDPGLESSSFNSLSGSFEIYDFNGYEIEKFNFKGIAIE